MAVKNKEFPTVVEYKDFDPGKVSPGQVVIVNILGMHAVYIGTQAGEATRMAAYKDWEEIEKKVNDAAERAEESRKNAAVLYELMQRTEKNIKEMCAKVERAVQDAEDIVKLGRKDVDSAAKSAMERMSTMQAEAEESARKAEEAFSKVNAAMQNLGETVRASLAAIAVAPSTGGKK